MVDGRLGMIPLEDFKKGMAATLAKEVPTLWEFRARWVDPPTRRELLDALVSAGYPPTVMRLIEDMNDYDLYDVIASVGYGLDRRPGNTEALGVPLQAERMAHPLAGKKPRRCGRYCRPVQVRGDGRPGKQVSLPNARSRGGWRHRGLGRRR